MAGSQSITNEIDNIVNIIDATAAGTQSATRNLDSLQDKAEAATQAIDGAADALEGVATRSATSTSTLSKGMDASAMYFLRMGQSVDVASKKMLQLQRAQDKLAQVQVMASTAVANGMRKDDVDAIVAGHEALVEKLEKETDAARSGRSALNDLTDAHARSTSAAKLTGYQLGIVADEAHKFADQILAGGSALTAAFYQLPNMIQTVGGLGNATKIATGFLSGPGGIVLAAGAAGVALSKMGAYAEGEQEHLAQLGQHLRATRDDYAQISVAAENAARTLRDNATGLSLSDSRSVTQTLAAVPTVDSTQLGRLTEDSRNLATVMGTDIPTAARTMASALDDPARAAQDFAQQGLAGFNAGLVLSIRHMEDAGNRSGALATLLATLESTTTGAAEHALTPFQKALHSLEDEAGGVGKAVTETFTHLGDGIVAMATSGINALTNLVAAVKKVPDEVEGIAGSVWSEVSAGASWVGHGLSSIVQDMVPETLGNLMAQASTPDPVFALPTHSVATASGQGTATLPATPSLTEQDKAVSSLSAHYAELQKSVDSAIGTDSSLSGQVEDQRRKILGLNTAIQSLNELHAAGRIREDQFAETMSNLTGQLTAANVALAGLRGPFAELIEQQQRAAQSAAALTGYDRAMVEASQQADDAARSLSGGLASASEKALVQAAAAQTLAAQFSTNLTVAQRNTAEQQAITAAWGQGAAAAEHATNYVQAYNYALDHFGSQSGLASQKASQLADELDRLSAERRHTELAQSTLTNDAQVRLIEQENATLGMNADARTRLISRMQAEQEQVQKGNSLQDQSVQTYLASKAAVTDASVAYEHHQQVLQDVTGSLSSMTDQLTDGITQGFLQGTSSGLSFRNILQGIETQVVSMIAKMALINPLLNKIDGGSRMTLADMENLFSGTSLSSGSLEELQQFSGAAGSNSSATGQLGQAIATSGWAPSELQALYGGASTSGQSGSTGGLSSGVGSASLSGVSLVSGKASSPFGSLSDMVRGQGGLLSSRGVSALGTLGGATSFGMGILGGIGMGSSVGSMTSSLTGGGASGMLGATIGSGVGAIGGGILGGPLGSMIGGTIVGAVGGLLGGLFSPSHYVYDSVIGSDGRLGIGSTRSHKASDDVREGLQSSLDTLNAVYSDAGITVGDGGYGEVGHYQKGSNKSSKTLQDLLPGVRLSSDNATENLALQQVMPSTFDSVESYTQTIESIRQLADTLDALHVSVSKFDDATHVTVGHISGYTGELGQVLAGFDGKSISTSALQSEISTLKSLLDLTDSGAQSLVSQVADLRDKYQQAADEAQRYGLDYQVILDKGSAIAQSMLDAETTKLAQSDQSVQARLLAAQGDQEGSDLITFDVSAAQQRKALDDEWRGYLGDSYADNQDYATQMADLDRTLAAERLKIQQTYAGTSLAQQEQYLSQAQQSVAGVFTSLASYVQGLNTSDVSPLSAQQQYDVANENFQTDYRSAMGGDYDALSRVQGDAQTLLPLAQSYLGSGQDYAQLYQKTLEKLQSLGGVNTDTVTAALMQKLAQAQVTATGQTTQAVEKLGSSLTTELRQLNMLLTTRT